MISSPRSHFYDVPSYLALGNLLISMEQWHVVENMKIFSLSPKYIYLGSMLPMVFEP